MSLVNHQATSVLISQVTGATWAAGTDASAAGMFASASVTCRPMALRLIRGRKPGGSTAASCADMREAAMKTVRCGEGGGTAPVPAHRQIACRLPPQRRAAWRRLDAILEDQRQLYSAALEERIGCCRKTGKGLSYSGQCRALTECRRDIPGMAACPVAVQRGTLKRLDEAFRHFFRRAKARCKAANRPHDLQQDVSRRIAGRAGTVVLGRLNVRGMTRSPMGTVESPGRNVRQKAGLNRAIAGTGWTAFAAMLEYRAANVIHLPAACTSQTCHDCGAVDAANRRSQAESICVACGHEASADVNAAKNIPASGAGASVRRGALAPATPVAREISIEAT